MDFKNQKAIEVGGIPVDLFTEKDYENLLVRAVKEGRKECFFNSNAHLVVLANEKHSWLKKVFKEQVEYVMCDGAGIQLGAWIKGKAVPNKIAYNVWFWNFAKFCKEKDYKLFFLGAKSEVVGKAADVFRERIPGIQIKVHHGYFDKSNGSSENERVIKEINNYGPQVLLVGFGMPNQERWILNNRGRISANAFFPCGGAFDFFSGNKSVAPKLFRDLKLEWFYRMLLEPGRLGKRYLLENPRFIFHVLRNP